MDSALEHYKGTVAAMTADGQPFALQPVTINGVDFQTYATMPANLGAYCAIMQQHGDREFVVYRDQRYSFAETWARSAAVGAGLQRKFGIAPGDRVAIASRNNPEWMMAFIAIVSIGAVAVPMNAWWTSSPAVPRAPRIRLARLLQPSSTLCPALATGSPRPMPWAPSTQAPPTWPSLPARAASCQQ